MHSAGTLLIFDVSGGELLVILTFVLLFFGSKGIPGIARTMGRTMRQIRDASAEVQREIQRGATEVKQEVDQNRRLFQQEDAARRAGPSEPPAATEPSPVQVKPTDGEGASV